MNRARHLRRLANYRAQWPHMSSLYSGGSSREDEEQKYVEPGSVFDNVYENPSEPYGAYKFYMAPREEFVIQSEPQLYPVRALYKEDDDRTSGYATSGGSNSLKDGSSKRILLCVFLVFFLICAVIAAVVMAVLISHQRRMKPLQPDHQQQDVLESNIRIANRTFITEYSDPSSPQYKILETEFCQGIDAMFFRTDSPMKEEYKGCKVLSFRAGSVIARYLLMFLWKDKKPLHLMVDQVGDFIKETIPKKGIWNPLFLNGESLNLYPVEITNLEPTLYPPEKEPKEKEVTKDVTGEIISISSPQNIYPTDRLSRSKESTLALSSKAYSTNYLSGRGATLPSSERASARLMSTFRADDKLYPSESVMQPGSEILATVLRSSKSISLSPENIQTIYSDKISKQFSKMPTFSSIRDSKMDVLPTHSDAMSPISESKIPINSVRDNIDSHFKNWLPENLQPPKPKDPLKEFKSEDDFFNFFNQPPTSMSSTVKDQKQDSDLDLLLSNGIDLHKFLFPSLDQLQATLSTTISENTYQTTSVTTPTEPLRSFQFYTVLTTSDYINGPSLPTFQMVTSSNPASETYDQTVYTDAIPSVLRSTSSTKAAQPNIDKPFHSVLPAFSQKTQTSEHVFENLKPTSQTYFQMSSLSLSRSPMIGITSSVGVTPSISTFGSDGDLFNFFSDASHLGTPPPEISRFSLGDPKLHSETDKTQSFGGFGDFFSHISEIEDSTNDMLPPNVLMASAESVRDSSAFYTQNLKSNSERILDTVTKHYPSTSSTEYSDRLSDLKLENIEDSIHTLQSSMTSIFPEKRQENEKSNLNSEYGSVFMSSAQKLVSTPEDINTPSDVREHGIRSSSSIQTNNVEMLTDKFLDTLVNSMTPSVSFSGISSIKDGIIDEKDTLPFSSKQQNTLSIKMISPTESVEVLPQSKHQSKYSEDRNLESSLEGFVAISSAVQLQNIESKEPLNVDNIYLISSENTVFLSTISLENTGSHFGENLKKASYPVHDTSDLYSLSSASYYLSTTTPLYQGILTSSLNYDPISKVEGSLRGHQSSVQPSKLSTSFSPPESDKMFDLKSSIFLNVASDLSLLMSKQTTTTGFQERISQNSLDFSILPSLTSAAYEFSEQSISNSDGFNPSLSIQEDRSSIKSIDDSITGENFRTETQLSDLESSEFMSRSEETMSTWIVLPTPSVDSVSNEQIISSQSAQEVFSSNLNMNTPLDAKRIPTNTHIVYAESMKNSDAPQITNTSTVKSEMISSDHILPTHSTPITVFSNNTEILPSGVSSIPSYTQETQSFSFSNQITPSLVEERIIKGEISFDNSPTETLFPETSKSHLPLLETLSKEEITHSKSLESSIKSSTSVALDSSGIQPDSTGLKEDSFVSSETIQSSFKTATLDFGSFSQLNSFTNNQLQPSSPSEILGYSSGVRVSEEMMKSVRNESKSPTTLSDITTLLIFPTESVEESSNNQHTNSLTLNKFSGIPPDSMTSALTKLQHTYSIQAPSSHSHLFSVNPTSVQGLDQLSMGKQLETTATDGVFHTSPYSHNVWDTTVVSSNLLTSEAIINLPSEDVSNKFSHLNLPDVSLINESISTQLDLKTVVRSTFLVEPSRDIVDESSPLDIAKTQVLRSGTSTVQPMHEILHASYSLSSAESLTASSVYTAYNSEILDNLLNQFLEQSNTDILSITSSLSKSSEASIVFLNTDSYTSFGVTVSDILPSSSVRDPLTYTFNQELATEPHQGQLTSLPNLASVNESIKRTEESLGVLSTDKLMSELTSDVSTTIFVPSEDVYSKTEQTKDIGQTAEGTTRTLYQSKPNMMLEDTLSTDLLNAMVDRASTDSFKKELDSINSSKITSTGLFQISETRVSSFATSYSSYQLKSLLDVQTHSMLTKDSSLSNIESSMSIEGLPISNILKDFPSKTQNFVNSVILESSLIQKTKSRDFSSSLMHSKPLDNFSDLQPSRQQSITTSTITSVSSIVFYHTSDEFLDVGSIKPIYISSTDDILQTSDLLSDIETIGIQSSSTNDILESTVTTPEIDILKKMETILTFPLESGYIISKTLETAQSYSSYVKSENIDTSIISSNTEFQEMDGLNTISNLEQLTTLSYTSSSKSEQFRMVDYNDSTVQASALSTRASSLQPSRLLFNDIQGESFLKQIEISSSILPSSEMLNNFTESAIPTLVKSAGSFLISSSAFISDIQTMDGIVKHDVMYSSSPFTYHVSDQHNVSEPDINQFTHTMSLESTLTMFSNVLTSDFIVPSKTLVNTLTPTNPLPSIPFFQSEPPLIQTLVRESTTVISENILPSTIQLVTITEYTNESIQRNDSLLTTSEIFPTKASSDFSSTVSDSKYTSFNLTDSLVIDPHPSGNLLHSSSEYKSIESIESLLSSKSENYSQIAATFDLTSMLEGGESHMSSQTLSVLSIQNMTTPLYQSEFSLVQSILSLGNTLANQSSGTGLELPDISSLSVSDASTTEIFPTKVETQSISILSNFTQQINQLLATEMQTVSSNVPIYTQTDTLEDNTWPFTIAQTLGYNNSDNASSSPLFPTQTESYFSSAMTKSIEPENSIVQTPSADTSSNVVSPIKNVNPDSQTNTPIQTTPYDVASDTLLAINEDIPSLNFDSQTINPNTQDSPINSTEYLFGSVVIFSSLESSVHFNMHELISQSSSYQSSLELTRGKNTVHPFSNKFSKTTFGFGTLSTISVDDSSVLFGELLSYGKGISSQTSAILSTNDPSLTVLYVSPSLLSPMLSDSFSEKHATNAMFLTSIPDHSLFIPQFATISSLSTPELTTEINSAGIKKMGKIRVEPDDILQENKTLRSISLDIAGIHKPSGVLEDYFTNVGMNKKVSHSEYKSLRYVTIDGNERYKSTSLSPMQYSTQYLLSPHEDFGEDERYSSSLRNRVNIISSSIPSETIANSNSQSINNRLSLMSHFGNDLLVIDNGNIVDEIFSNKLSSVSLDNTHDLYSEISISLDSLTQISINTNVVWSTEIKSSFSYDAIETIVPSMIINNHLQTNLFKTSKTSVLPGSPNDFRLSNYISQESVLSNSIKFWDTIMHQSDPSTTTFKLDSSMPYPSVKLFSYISSIEIHPSQTQLISEIKSWSSNSLNNQAEVLTTRDKELSFDATKIVQNETSTVQATLVPHTYIKSSTSVITESSVDTFLFTAANDYDYYATNLDFVTDYVDFTAPKVIDTATISPSSSVPHSSDLNNLPVVSTPYSVYPLLKNPVKDNGKPAGGLLLMWPVVDGDSHNNEKRKQKSRIISSQNYIGEQNLRATGEAENVIEPSLQRLPKIDVQMTTPLFTSTEKFVTSSSIPSDMDYDDPFAAFFGARGPAIPQWVIDMLGSVHDFPSSTAKLYFRH